MYKRARFLWYWGQVIDKACKKKRIALEAVADTVIASKDVSSYKSQRSGAARSFANMLQRLISIDEDNARVSYIRFETLDLWIVCKTLGVDFAGEMGKATEYALAHKK